MSDFETLASSGSSSLRTWDSGEPVRESLQSDSSYATARLVNSGVVLASGETALELDCQVLAGISAKVRHSIEYRHDVKPWESSTQGDCYSFSWATDELANEAGYDTRIAFCNSHAFNLVVGVSRAVHMIHSELRHMSLFDIANHSWTKEFLSPDSLSQIVNQVEPVLYLPVSTRRLSLLADNYPVKNELVRLPWLDGEWSVLSSMQPDFAHDALRAYAEFKRSVLDDNSSITATTSTLDDLVGHNPQADTNAKNNWVLRTLKRRVGEWSDRQDIGNNDLIGLIATFDSAAPIRNKALSQNIGDMFKRIAKARRSAGMANLALAYYEDADCRSLNPHDTILPAKIAKTEALVLELDGPSADDFSDDFEFPSLAA